MNREIKFRVWDTRVKKMYCPDDGQIMRDEDSWLVDSITAVNASFHNRDYVWQQYTGLKDKNSKEIYEGDIIKIDDDWDTYGLMSGEVREVIFRCGGFRFKPEDDESKGHWLEDDNEFEVIGNIHQHPELIK